MVYRLPRLPFSKADTENTAKLCHLLENLQGNVLTVGDFNSLGIDWVRNFSNSVGEKVFIDVLSRKFGNQPINFHTQKSGSLLDLLISSHPELVRKVQDEGFLGESNHTMV